MQICWLTDTHLNFLSHEQRVLFYKTIAKQEFDVIVITGDIADAPTLTTILQEMVNSLKKPIYFVLGNHDFYNGDIVEVKAKISSLCAKEPLLTWLGNTKSQRLTDDAVLLGQDGWGDGRYGDYNNSSVNLNDSRLIYDLFTTKLLGRDRLLEKMQELADADADALETSLTEAVKSSAQKIIILTHVPPFVGACWHEGSISDNNWLPFFSSKAMGDVILKFAEKYPQLEFLILCGHTHSDGIYQPLDNLLIKTGRAEYYLPIVQEIISV